MHIDLWANHEACPSFVCSTLQEHWIIGIPFIINGLASDRQIITIDNAGVGKSEGETPDNVQEMATCAIKIIAALGI